MNGHIRLAAIALPLVLSACGTSPPSMQQKSSQASQNPQLELILKSGVYACEQKIRIKVERRNQQGINRYVDIVWDGSSHHLERDRSYSGLPRFEDVAGDLVWIDLPWKSLLLDNKTGKPLASECRPS